MCFFFPEGAIWKTEMEEEGKWTELSVFHYFLCLPHIATLFAKACNYFEKLYFMLLKLYIALTISDNSTSRFLYAIKT